MLPSRPMKCLAATALLMWAHVAWSAPPVKGVEQVSHARVAARYEALSRVGDIERGREVYQVCVSCHFATGSGRSDGVYPQLAGQHATVIIKQINDIRTGLRDNSLMYPFATTLTDPQELADLAAYIGTLEVSPNGRGPGRLIEAGKTLYQRDCRGCHGARGEGNADAFIPALASQHYRYLLRQLISVREGTRRNANPTMAKLVETYSPKDLEAVADYVSTLTLKARR